MAITFVKIGDWGPLFLSHVCWYKVNHKIYFDTWVRMRPKGFQLISGSLFSHEKLTLCSSIPPRLTLKFMWVYESYCSFPFIKLEFGNITHAFWKNIQMQQCVLSLRSKPTCLWVVSCNRPWGRVPLQDTMPSVCEPAAQNVAIEYFGQWLLWFQNKKNDHDAAGNHLNFLLLFYFKVTGTLNNYLPQRMHPKATDNNMEPISDAHHLRLALIL